MSGLRKTLLWLGLASCVLGLRFACGRVADRGRFAAEYSSYGSGPKGARALYLLAERLGARPRRWAEDLAALPPGRGMLLALGDCDTAMARVLSRYERHELERWVDQGGVVLVAGARHYLPASLGVQFAPDIGCRGERRLARMEREEKGLPPEPIARKRTQDAGTEGAPDGGGVVLEDEDDATVEPGRGAGKPASDDAVDPRVSWAIPEGAALRGLEPVPMRRPGELVFESGVEHEPLLLLQRDEPGAEASDVREVGVVVRHGRGFVIVLASGSMLQNRSLAKSDGAVMFARLRASYAPSGPLLFDEYHLGVGERRSLMRYLREAGATPFALQLGLAVALFLWRGGARFGGLRDPEAPPPSGAASLVTAMGRLFARAGDPKGALQILAKQALDRVAAFHHLPLQAGQGLEHTLRDRGLITCAEAVREITSVQRAELGPGGLAVASRRLDRAVAQATTVALTLPPDGRLG